MTILWGLLGMTVVLGIAYLLSSDRQAINFRTIIGGLAIQLLFAFLVLYSDTGRWILEQFTGLVNQVIGFAGEGINFLFGGLFEAEGVGTVFAFEVLTVVIFFSSLISVLYYLGIMQRIINSIGGALAKLLGTSRPESLSAAANIFVGQTEAPLVVKPFLPQMTRSELFAVMTGGLASVAGSVLIGYSLLGIPLEYLLAASFMAAPSGLVLAKIMLPETDPQATSDEREFQMDEDQESYNVIDAAARGASTGLQLALNIGAMLLAFIALIALLNGILGGVESGINGSVNYMLSLFGSDSSINIQGLTLENIFGILFSPLAFAIGVPWSEAFQAGSFIGQKLILNEFVAYAAFAPEIDSLDPKTVLVVSFALCGFANVSSLGILLGGLGKLAPSRRGDIAQLGLKAVMAGMLASLLNASIAGMFF
ncbi:NupC/NupG family nucleoside CNT transporter [Salipaludibacillus agaradhaerens]|uniref:Nucleoside permease n=1 Tax=Salipaludibacillus agaradhaerens TaxID=76935 RepID=A0A9Q4B385_SALAG|nr:NupC/NupG family nucleoside CNT transporter [Salipaludibacillus agaradhaerens]MCR6097509.1 NupC/NupG family nucleoside CNT transporter [Salipaludibacillus agaradhaerens]MCR6113007.1 NupC/NupG family nucleoside CNT transporter [Salipaludibacillus agaradhaerens]